jgi:hypothetical protein
MLLSREVSGPGIALVWDGRLPLPFLSTIVNGLVVSVLVSRVGLTEALQIVGTSV